MQVETNESGEDAFTLDREEADQLVAAALDTDLDEPEPFVKLLLTLFDNSHEGAIQDALHQLMKAAYDSSIVHSSDFQEYLDAIRRGRDPLQEARSRMPSGD